MKKIKWTILAAFLVTVLIAFASCGGASDSGEESEKAEPAKADAKITCENGVMLGQTTDGVTSFKGIPYAKPPVDKLRWKAPQAPDPSDEEIECFDFGYTALQYEWPTEPASSFPKNEDCLTLNIWESEGTAEGENAKPIMVFFHGGAYGWGGTTDPMYDGHNFVSAHEDVILITCNYRLGLMSMADFTKVKGGEEYTDLNLHIRDHIAALEWIQKNASAFGGDPENVTIFGESAGGWSTTALAISPKAKGLFSRVIAQSGGPPFKEREEAQEFADYIMESAGAKTMDDLLAISGDEWMKLDEENWIADEFCGIIPDGDVIPLEEDMDDAIAEAAKSGIQLMIGSNKDEWNYFLEDSEGETDDEKLASWVEGMDEMYNEAYKDSSEDGKAALKELMKYEEENVPEEYAGDEKVKSALAKSGCITEFWRYDIMDIADKFADAGGNIYTYLWEIPSTKDEMFKSSVHAVELAYIFNNPEGTIYAGEVDKVEAKKTQEAWINFAKEGDPSTEGTEWPKYDTADRNTMVIAPKEWKAESDPVKTPRELLERAFGDEPYHVW